jgi:membrane-associated protein
VILHAETFYAKTGWWAVIAARFIPWVRTFVPPIAGASKMNYYTFLSANILGAVVWGGGISIAGYYAASIPAIQTISYAVALFFIIGSVISGFVNYLRRPR